MIDALFPVDEHGYQAFAVELDVFSGPFSLLLSLIAKKKLDVSTVALAEVTDEFIAFVNQHSDMDLSATSEFIVVAATLLDLKLARLLPHEDDAELDFELLEQRDLLFAKRLQYRAFKDVAADFFDRLASQARAFPRDVPMEEQYAQALPEVRLSVGGEELALLAVHAFSRDHEAAVVPLAQLHDPLVSVRSQIDVVAHLLASRGSATFRELCESAPNRATIVSRFMAILEMMRNRQVVVEQEEPLGPLIIAAPGKDAHV